MSPEYLLTRLVVCLAPGIGVVCTLSVALAQGMHGGVWASVGCTLATIVHMAVAVAGLAAMTFAVFLGYAALAASGREAVLSRPAIMAWLSRAFAASFAALGLRLAMGRA